MTSVAISELLSRITWPALILKKVDKIKKTLLSKLGIK